MPDALHISDEYRSLLPDTEALTAPSIQLYVQPNTFGARQLIGAVMGYTRSFTRNTLRRLELDSSIPGQAIEIIPLAVSNFTITIKRAALNTESMMEALGFDKVEDLMLTATPILIEEVRSRFDRVKNKKYQRILRYNGCILKSNPINVDLYGDWMIVQECELDVATCELDDEHEVSN